MTRPLRLYYSESQYNFGDIVNPLLLERIFGQRSVRTHHKKAEFYAIGSLLQKLAIPRKNIFRRICHHYRPCVTLWGTGFISALSTQDFCIARPIKPCAVRGKLSKQQLEAMTGKHYDIPLGDGGLLLDRLLDVRPAKKYAIGIVPHYSDYASADVSALASQLRNATVVNVIGDPIETLKHIAECETILSSSLHGLIAADSLHIPNMRLEIGSNVTGGDFKFHDYYSVFDIHHPEKITIEKLLMMTITESWIADRYQITPAQVSQVQQNLINAWPY